MPSEKSPFTPSSILFRPRRSPPFGRARVEAPGTAPGSDWFIAVFVYRHSRPESRQREYRRSRGFGKGARDRELGFAPIKKTPPEQRAFPGLPRKAVSLSLTAPRGPLREFLSPRSPPTGAHIVRSVANHASPTRFTAPKPFASSARCSLFCSPASSPFTMRSALSAMASQSASTHGSSLRPKSFST